MYGLSAEQRDAVVNLSDGQGARVCYLSGHTAVVYSYQDDRVKNQSFLQVMHCVALLMVCLI